MANTETARPEGDKPRAAGSAAGSRAASRNLVPIALAGALLVGVAGWVTALYTQAKSNALRADLDKARAELSVAGDLNTLEQRRDAARIGLAEVERGLIVRSNELIPLIAAVDARTRQLHVLTADLDEVTAKAGAMRRSVDESRAAQANLDAQRDARRDELAELDHELLVAHNTLVPAAAAVEARNRQVRQATADANEAETRLAEDRKALASVESTHDDLVRAVADLQEQERALIPRGNELVALVAAIDARQSQLRNTVGELDETKAAAATAAADLARLEETRTRLGVEIADLQSRQTALVGMIDLLKREGNFLRQAAQTSLSEGEQAQARLIQVRAQLVDLEGRRDQLHAELLTLSGALSGSGSTQ